MLLKTKQLKNWWMQNPGLIPDQGINNISMNKQRVLCKFILAVIKFYLIFYF